MDPKSFRVHPQNLVQRLHPRRDMLAIQYYDPLVASVAMGESLTPIRMTNEGVITPFTLGDPRPEDVIEVVWAVPTKPEMYVWPS